MWYLSLFDPDNLGLCPESHTLEGFSPLSFSSCDPLGASGWLNPFSRQTLSTQFPRIPYPNGPDPIFRASVGLLGFILLRTDRTTRTSTSKSKGWPRVICLQVVWASTCVCEAPCGTGWSQDRKRQRVDFGVPLLVHLSQDPQILGLVLGAQSSHNTEFKQAHGRTHTCMHTHTHYNSTYAKFRKKQNCSVRDTIQKEKQRKVTI